MRLLIVFIRHLYTRIRYFGLKEVFTWLFAIIVSILVQSRLISPNSSLIRIFDRFWGNSYLYNYNSRTKK